MIHSEICGKACKKSSLQLHVNRHHGKDHVPCTVEGCGKVFKHVSVLKEHMLTHQKKDYLQCHQCGWVGGKDTMRYHINTKHKSDQQRPFKCTMCPKGFGLKKHLEDHINTHTGNKPYSCSYCGAKFASEGNRNAHVRSAHKGIKRGMKTS